MKKAYLSFLLITLLFACNNKSSRSILQFSGQDGEMRLIVIDPGHFHASLLQRSDIRQVNDTIRVYAPAGEELNQYITAVKSFNSRADNPTSWELVVYEGTDYLRKAMDERAGNVVILAGNNQYKTKYITAAIDAGLNVLSDKPMAINKKNFISLQEAYRHAEQKDIYLYDLMTERYDVLNIVEKMLINNQDLFGELRKGTVDDPAISMESVHHFYKEVDGQALIRPGWYYDVEQQGEGIADVTTHLIDLVNWKCFPEQIIDYQQDVKVPEARHWATQISKKDFKRSTQMDDYPPYLNKYLQDSVLQVNANGTINYQVKGVHIGLKVRWNFQAPEGGGDTFSSVVKGSKVNLITVQDAVQGFKKQLFVEKTEVISNAEFIINLTSAIKDIQKRFPFVSFENIDNKVLIVIPQEDRLAHEVHFGMVAQSFFDYLVNRNMPIWENLNTLAKYYITTTATEKAKIVDE
ncbi:MAG: hypothetical protein M0Q54_08545 [Pigmentiphaga sp.]|nr:hypothetical protein [Pigmentiphaga sp.]